MSERTYRQTDRQTDVRQALFAEHNKEKPSEMRGALISASKCSLSQVMDMLHMLPCHM